MIKVNISINNQNKNSCNLADYDASWRKFKQWYASR